VRRAVVLPENYAVLEVMRAGELEEILWKIGDENLFAEGALVGGLIQAAYTSLFIAGMSQIPTEEVTPPPPEPEEPGVWVPGEEGPGTGPTH